MIKSISPATLKKWLEQQEAIVIDVREPSEHAAERIKGASLLPLAHVCKQKLPPLNAKKLVIHCRSGKRSQQACEKLLAEEPNLEIYNLEGGILAWDKAGYAVERSGKFFLPLDRQVQLVIGGCVFLGSILSCVVSPWFLLLTGFFGLGLLFAGITGYCGLAVLLAKMPWNQKLPKHGTSCTMR